MVALSAVALPNASPGDLLLDWGEWEENEAPRSEVDIATSMRQVAEVLCVEESEGPGCQPLAGKELRRMLKTCAARLELPGNLCKDKEGPVLEADYRMPFMESGTVSCGFEVRSVHLQDHRLKRARPL